MLRRIYLNLPAFILALACTLVVAGCGQQPNDRSPLRPSKGTPNYGALTKYDGVEGIWRHKQGLAYIAGPGNLKDLLFRHDINAWVETLEQTNSSSVYLQLVRSHGGDGEPTQNPFINHDPAAGVDKSVLQHWYAVLKQLEEINVDVFLSFYDGSSSPWGAGDEVSAAEREFIVQVVNRFKTLNNIIWVIAEQYPEAYSPRKVKALGELVFQSDEYRHPIGVQKRQGTDFEEFANNPTISVFLTQLQMQEPKLMYAQALQLQAKAKGRYTPIIAELSAVPSGPKARQRAWASAMAGTGILAAIHNNVNASEQDLKDLARLQSWFEEVDLQGFRPYPQGAISTAQWVLADPYRDRYLIYAANGAEDTGYTLGVTGVLPGVFLLRWLDIKSGESFEQQVTGEVKFEVPIEVRSGATEIALSVMRLPSSRNQFPAAAWGKLTPDAAGIGQEALDNLADNIDGNGCVVRFGALVYCWGKADSTGDWGSASKPVIGSLIEIARSLGRLPGSHAPIADVGWALQGKDQYISWHQLVNMMSGYGRAEAPGEAWAYNDHAVKLYATSLERQLGQPMQTIAAELFERLQLSDPALFAGRDGHGVSTTALDVARIGWWWRNLGRWNSHAMLSNKTARHFMQPWVPHWLPRTTQETEPYLQLGSFGGGTDLVSDGPGYYGNSWWFNAPTAAASLGDRSLGLAWPDLPADTFMAVGHSGRELVAVIPSMELVVVWRSISSNWWFAPFKLGSPTSKLNTTLSALLGEIKPVTE